MFEVGQRVKRDEINSEWRYSGIVLHGIVTKRFSRPQKQYGKDFVLGPYPELYEVRWDNGKSGQIYLPHGIDKEEEDV